MSLRISQVIAGIDPRSGGPSFTVPPLCRSLQKLGHNVSLHCCEGPTTEIEDLDLREYKRDRFSTRLYLSREMAKGLLDIAKQRDIFHSHGLWMATSAYCDTLVIRHKVKHVVSVHGTLSPVALSKSYWRKKFMWWMLQRSILERAACIHVTSMQEYNDVRRMGISKPIAVISLGTELPSTFTPLATKQRKSRILYLGRIDPIKCLPNLLEAWSMSRGQSDDWELRIVGSGNDAYVDYVRSLIAGNIRGNVSLKSAVYGAEKEQEYSSADLFVLPSGSENFSLTVVEALSYGVPVIATLGTPWQILQERSCGWWVSNDSKTLGKTINAATSTSRDERAQMGERGRRLVKELYTWDALSHAYIALYEWLSGKQSRPDCVRID